MNVFVSAILWITYFISLYFAIFWLLVFLENRKAGKKLRLKSFPRVSIAIPAYNEEDTIEATLKSALKLEYPADKIEFIVVNDGSTDRTKGIAQELVKQNKEYNIKLINQKNKGKGAALNTAIKSSSGKYFVCLDSDSFVEKKALKKMLPYFCDDNVAAVLPSLKVRNPGNMIQRMQWYEYIINMFYKELMARLNSVHVAPGPFSIYRKSILEKVGGFDEKGNLTEDLEMALRLQSRNYKLIQVLDTTVYTIAPSNMRALYAQRNRWYKGSIINAVRYKRMLFNRKYGDFGLIQMPTILISGIIALTLILSTIYYSIKPYFVYYNNFKHVGFDFATFIRTFQFDFNVLDINYTVLFVAICMIAITIYVISKSHVSVNEKIVKFGWFSFAAYLFLYFFVLATMWIGIAFDLVTGKRQRW